MTMNYLLAESRSRMKKRLESDGNPIGTLVCNVLGHKYVVTRRVTYHLKEFQCAYCNKKVTSNEEGQLVELSQERKEINNILYRVHRNRRKKNGLGRINP